MFDKIGRLAEAAATNVGVSRRGFFGQLGRGALVVAGALGGLLGAGGPVRADSFVTCCGRYKCHPPEPGCVYLTADCVGYYKRRPKTCVWFCNGTYMRSRCS
jgi:hypothetical protein